MRGGEVRTGGHRREHAACATSVHAQLPSAAVTTGGQAAKRGYIGARTPFVRCRLALDSLATDVWSDEAGRTADYVTCGEPSIEGSRRAPALGDANSSSAGAGTSGDFRL